MHRGNIELISVSPPKLMSGEVRVEYENNCGVVKYVQK